MTEPVSFIPSRVKNCVEGGHVAGTGDIIDDGSGITLDELVGNKEYDSAEFSGMGRVVIPKKMVTGVNTLTHEAFEDSEGNDRENTIYVIQYDFTLGENITVPANCVLEFDGGSLSSGGENKNTINGNKCSLFNLPQYNIFNDCIIKDFILPYIDVRWFGAKPDFHGNIGEGVIEGTDNAPYFQRAFDNLIYFKGLQIFVDGVYLISSTVYVHSLMKLCGTYTFNGDSISDMVWNSGIVVGNNITAFEIDGSLDNHRAGMSVNNLFFAGNPGTRTSTLFKFTTYNGSGDGVSFFEKCRIHYFNIVLDIEINRESGTSWSFQNLDIKNIVARNNNKFIKTRSIQEDGLTLCNLKIENSVITGEYDTNAIDIEKCYGDIIIDNVILEGSEEPSVAKGRQPIKITTNLKSTTISIRDCYFEHTETESFPTSIYVLNTHDYPISVEVINCSFNYAVDITNAIISVIDAKSLYNKNSRFTDCTFKISDVGSIYVQSLLGCNIFYDYPQDINNENANVFDFSATKSYRFNELCYEASDALTKRGGSAVGADEKIISIYKLRTQDYRIYYGLLNSNGERQKVRYLFEAEDNNYKTLYLVCRQSPYGGEGSDQIRILIDGGTNYTVTPATVYLDTDKTLKNLPLISNKMISGASADRPPLDAQHKGFNYLDDTSGPIWWNGTVWVDETGTPV